VKSQTPKTKKPPESLKNLEAIAKNGSPVLTAYEPLNHSPVFKHLVDNPERDFMKTSDFLKERFSTQNTTIDHIVDVTDVSRSAIKKSIKALSLERGSSNRVFHGQAPFGWKLELGRLVEHKGEQRVIAEIIQLRSSGMSLRQIASQLDQSAIKTKKGRKWQASTILKILKYSK
jgi:hypothetical protein